MQQDIGGWATFCRPSGPRRTRLSPSWETLSCFDAFTNCKRGKGADEFLYRKEMSSINCPRPPPSQDDRASVGAERLSSVPEGRPLLHRVICRVGFTEPYVESPASPFSISHPIFSGSQLMAFNFGGSQSSAAQASTSFSFGSAPAGGLFGGFPSFSFAASQPQSAPAFGNPFGQSTSTPQFGLGGASSAAGLFGASTSALSFGSVGAFGAQSQAASAPSLFGGSSPSFGGFGASQTQFSFSAPASAAQNQLAPSSFSTGLPGQPDYSALKELEAIAAAYNPASPKYRFTALFLNVVDSPAARGKPADVDELQWRAAMRLAGGPDNPDRLWPVQAKGFKDLIARKDTQEEALREHASRLEAAERFSQQLARKHETVIGKRMEGVRRRHLELSHRLLTLMRHVDALEGRFALVQQLWDAQSQETVLRLSQTLRALESEVAGSSAGGLQQRVEALASAARLRAACPHEPEAAVPLSEESLSSVFRVLKQQADAITRLQEVVGRNKRDLLLLEDAGRQVVR